MAKQINKRIKHDVTAVFHINNNPFNLKGYFMTLEEVILELYRLAESKNWDSKITDEALSTAIEGMEHLWELRQADIRRNAMINASRKQPRVWC